MAVNKHTTTLVQERPLVPQGCQPAQVPVASNVNKTPFRLGSEGLGKSTQARLEQTATKSLGHIKT